MAEPVRIKVLFIGGYTRSGSTLLDRALGAVDGFFSAGELRHVFREGYVENRLCGCGEPFRECPFWNDVTSVAFGGMERFDARSLLADKERVDAYWRIPQIATGIGGKRARASRERYFAALRDLYSAIADVSGATAIVDSSKDVSHGYVLSALGEPVDPYVLHLVRDSRGAAHSWTRRKFNPGSGGEMERWGPARTGVEWVAINALTALHRRRRIPYALLRYDDLTRGPAAALRRALALVGEPGAELPFDGHGRLETRPHHTVAGNPIRFRREPIEIRPDERWRSEMPARSRALVTALTFPSLARYGFLGGDRPLSS